MIRIFIMTLFLLNLIGCSCSGGKNRTDSQWTRDMAQQHNVKAQEGAHDGTAFMRIPPEGTRARNRSYYPYSGKPEQAAVKLKNPLPVSKKVLFEGEKNYKRYCIYCHGSSGNSKEGATVVSKMILAPPSLLSEKVKQYSDGRIYHILYEGQGLMGSYRMQLDTNEQVTMSRYMEAGQYKGSPRMWSVIHYIRALQKVSSQKENQ